MKTENILYGITVGAIAGVILGTVVKQKKSITLNNELIDLGDTFQDELEEDLFNREVRKDAFNMDLSVDFTTRGQIPFLVG